MNPINYWLKYFGGNFVNLNELHEYYSIANWCINLEHDWAYDWAVSEPHVTRSMRVFHWRWFGSFYQGTWYSMIPETRGCGERNPYVESKVPKNDLIWANSGSHIARNPSVPVSLISKQKLRFRRSTAFFRSKSYSGNWTNGYLNG